MRKSTLSRPIATCSRGVKPIRISRRSRFSPGLSDMALVKAATEAPSALRPLHASNLELGS